MCGCRRYWLGTATPLRRADARKKKAIRRLPDHSYDVSFLMSLPYCASKLVRDEFNFDRHASRS